MGKHRFTPESARENQRLAVIAYWRNREKSERWTNGESAPGAEEPQSAEEAYRKARLHRVRRTINGLHYRIEQAIQRGCDVPKIKGLSDAMSELQELERKLAGRPLPGSLKPNGKEITPKNDEPNPVEPTDTKEEPTQH